MGGGGVQRIVKFLKYWDYSRFRVSVLTVKPSFFYSRDESLTAEVPAGVQVLRSGSLDPFRWMYLLGRLWKHPGSPENRTALPYESRGWWRRAAMSLFVPDSRLLWLPFAVGKLGQLHRREPVSAIVATMPPFTAGLIGAVAHRWRKIPLILDFRDAWIDNPYMPSMPRLHRNINKRFERWCLRQAEGIIFVNPALEAHYRRRYPELSGLSVTTIRNGYDPEDFTHLPSGQNADGPTGKFRVGIIGTIYSQGNRPLSLLRAIQELRREDATFGERFTLVFLGKWSPDFVEEVREMHLEGAVEFIPYRPHREALRLAAGFDALALCIEGNLPGSAAVTPGRIYEYLYLKKPILAVCPPESDLATLVRECRAGEVVPPEDTGRIKTVLRRWVDRPASLRKDFQFSGVERFSRPRQAEEFMRFLERVLR